MHLQQAIEGGAAGKAQVIAHGRSRTADELSACAATSVLEAVSEFEGAVLCFRDPLRLIVALIALDGKCDRLLLLSPDTTQDAATDLMVAADLDLVLTDDVAVDAGISLHWNEPIKPRLYEERVRGEGRETRWLLATSGTTGARKLVAHTLASLTRTISTRTESAALRWGQLYDQSRLAGVQVMLQALCSGADLALAPPDAALEDILDLFAETGVTAISATPTYWRKIMMMPQAANLELEQITLGGEIADDAVLSALASCFPDARICHIYASTEAGAVFAVTDGRAGFPVSFLDRPPRGIDLKVRDGRLWVRGGGQSTRYQGTGRSFADEGGFIDTGDAVRIEGDRCIFEGRANGTINVGGNKLHPEEVERVLLDHPAVRFARISGMKSPVTGQIVRAEVVLALPETDRGAARWIGLSREVDSRDRLDALPRPGHQPAPC